MERKSVQERDQPRRPPGSQPSDQEKSEVPESEDQGAGDETLSDRPH